MRRAHRLEISLGVIGAGWVTLSFVFARTGIPRWIPPAPLVLVHIASPTTGMTRSFVAMASGHVARAFGWHPLGPIVFVASIIATVVAARALVQRRAPSLPFLRTRALWLGVAVAFAAAWVRQIIVLRV
ncbi:MAG: DUF2752 domain-containing protein [Actinomycetota bacterium]